MAAVNSALTDENKDEEVKSGTLEVSKESEAFKDFDSVLKLHGGEEADDGTKVVDSSAPDENKKEEVKSGGTVLFYRPEPKKPTGKLIFRGYDEEGRVVFNEIDCVIMEGANMTKSRISYLRAARGEKVKQEPAGSCVKAVESVQKALKKAIDKQVGFEADYPEMTSCLKYFVKSTIPFPANAIAELPSLYDRAKSVYKVIGGGGVSKTIKAAAMTEGPKIVSWLASCVAANWFNESNLPSFVKVVETLWEETYLKRAEESQKDKEGDRLLISVLLKEGEANYNGLPVAMYTFEFEECGQEERDQNEKDFSGYLPGDWYFSDDEETQETKKDSPREDNVESGMKGKSEENKKV